VNVQLRSVKTILDGGFRMNRYYLLVVLAALLAPLSTAAALDPGIQVTSCEDVGGGVWRYNFFACAPNINANDLHLVLGPTEIGQGEVVVGCGAPALPGFSCNFTPTEASWVFPTIGSFDCVPTAPDEFTIDISSPDGLSLIEEIWTLDGAVMAGFVTVITCPTVSVEPDSWGRVKTLYR